MHAKRKMCDEASRIAAAIVVGDRIILRIRAGQGRSALKLLVYAALRY
jgi:hypothetical protein